MKADDAFGRALGYDYKTRTLRPMTEAKPSYLAQPYMADLQRIQQELFVTETQSICEVKHLRSCRGIRYGKTQDCDCQPDIVMIFPAFNRAQFVYHVGVAGEIDRLRSWLHRKKGA